MQVRAMSFSKTCYPGCEATTCRKAWAFRIMPESNIMSWRWQSSLMNSSNHSTDKGLSLFVFQLMSLRRKLNSGGHKF